MKHFSLKYQVTRNLFIIALSSQVPVISVGQFTGLIVTDPYGDAGQGPFHLRKGANQVVQTNGEVLGDLKYFYEASPLGIYLRDKSTVSFVLWDASTDSATADTAWRVDMEIGNRDLAPLEAGSAVGGLANYYQGGLVAEEVKAFERAVYPEAFDSTDVHFYYGTSGPRVAFVVRPGGNPESIRLRFNGQDSLGVDWQGALKVYVGEKQIRLEQAIAYQIVNGAPVPLTWIPAYEYIDGTAFVTLEILDYNTALPLVFLIGYPPLMMGGGGEHNFCWSTYFGGALATVHALDADDSGGLYVGGSTQSNEFPATLGVSTNPGEFTFSAVAAKFNANHQLLWATYYGGLRSEEIKSIAYSSYHSALFFAGYSNSPNLPTPSISGAYQDNSYNQPPPPSNLLPMDGMFGRLMSGTGQLSFASYWGTVGEDRAMQIVCDPSGNHWLIGYSAAGIPLVEWGSAYSSSFQGGLSDGFVARFNATGQLIWSTHVGGNNNESLTSARLDDEGNLYIGGYTRSSNFPTASDCGVIAQASFVGGARRLHDG